MATADTTIDLRERRLRRHVPKGRALHLVDIENLAGGSGASPSDVDAALAGYERTVRFGAGDHRVVACGRGLVYPVADRWPGALVRVARGIDGADRLLLQAGAAGPAAARFDRVVVASGDHAFAPLVGELARLGVDVAVVCRRGALARRLVAVAPVVRFVDDLGLAAA